MKIIRDDDGNVTAWQSETDAEKAAIEYVTSHVPLFAASTIDCIHAFEAGAKWAEETRKP